MSKIIGATIKIDKNSNGKWVASGTLIVEEEGKSIFCEGIGGEYETRAEMKKAVKEWLLQVYSLNKNIEFTEDCDQCGAPLQPSQYASLKKEGERATKIDDDVVCRNYLDCKEAEKEIEKLYD